MWDASKCDLCGDCLVNCRYVNYDRDKAIANIKLLMEGKDAEILSKCTTCIACSSYCPTGADPANLIFKMQEKIGTSPIVVVGKPLCEEVVRAFEKREDQRQLIAGAPDKPALSFEAFRFDYQQVIPGDPDKPALSLDAFRFDYFPEGTFDSQLFKGLTIVRGGQYASLVGYVHMGGESLVEKYGQRVLDNLASLGKDIVYIHNEGFILAHIKAREYGFKVRFRYMHLFEYLRNYLKAHKKNITRLGKKIAYHANCATRLIPEYDDFLDEMFELVGVERPARKYEHLNAVCCTAPLIYVDRELAVDIQKRNFEDAIACGADAIVTSCPLCQRILTRPSSEFRLPNIFITDLCRIALGEKPWPDGSR